MKKRYLILFFLFFTFSIYSVDIDTKYLIPLNSISAKIDINKLNKNKPYKLIFITTWCNTCKTRLKEIKKNNMLNSYIYIFGNYGIDDIEIVKQFVNSHSELKYVFFDDNNILREHFKIKVVPSEIELVK